MKELIPKGLPKGKDLVREGREIAKSIRMEKTAFEKERNLSFDEWRRKETTKGNIIFFPFLGLRTLDEQVEGTRKLYEECRNRGVDIGVNLVISNVLNGLPPHLREEAPKGTSFLYEGPEDFRRITQAAPVYPIFGDHMVCSPNSVENVRNVLSAGASKVGTLSQYTWKYPYWDDDVGQVAETVKAIGILAGKRDDRAQMGSYIGDGIAGSFIDHASEVGYALLEHYVVEQLCGASYCLSLGGLMSHLPSKLATWLAVFEAAKSVQPNFTMAHYEGNTVEVTEDTAANYGLVVGDFIPFAVLERKYRTGIWYTPKPVTEALRVPTVEESIDVVVACKAAMARVQEIEEAGIFDDSEIVKLKETILSNGRKFFENILSGLPEMGVDVQDPLQVLLAVRRLGGSKLEEQFHPGERDPQKYRGIVPIAITDLFRGADPLADSYADTIRSEGLADALQGRKIVAGSADTHEFGLYVLHRAMTDAGGRIVNAGVDLDPQQVLDLASREATPYMAISIHNGQCVGWGEQLMREATRRGQETKVFMGGVLNTMEESSTEPVDASEKLIELGITPCEDPVDFARKMAGSSH